MARGFALSERRTGTAVLVVVLFGVLVTPLSVGAQTGDITLPAGTSEGSVMLGGSVETEGFRTDDTHYLDRRTVTSSNITFDIDVDSQGQVTDGTMTVDIRWSGFGTGTTPVTGDTYLINSTSRKSGTLDLEGTADRLVATGSLTTESSVYDTDGNFIKEVSGTREDEVGWVFQATGITCGMVTGKLVEAWGSGLMVSAKFPRKVREGDSETRNELVSVFRLLSPDASADAEMLAMRIGDLNEAANPLLAEPTPTVADLARVLGIAEALRADLARLERCKLTLDPSGSEDWLAAILQSLLVKALEQPELWNAQDLIHMLNIGVRGGAVDAIGSDPTAAELYEEFGDALEFALGEAIASSDLPTIIDIASASASYGYSCLYEAATAAIEELSQ
jgi:hypothetical protein